MNYIGVVLAGGQSRRMGEDKALLKLQNGKTLLQQSIHLLNQCGIDNVVISGDRVDGIADKIANMGPLSAIETIIHKTHSDRLIIIPVDMPLLSNRLISELLKSDNDETVYFQNHYLPLNLAVTKKNTAIIGRLLAQQESRQHSIKNFLSQIPVKILPLKKTQAIELQNINTPEQWQQLNTNTQLELTTREEYVS